MPLPKIVLASKTVHLPILNQDVEVNAFNVGEERILVSKKAQIDEKNQKPEDKVMLLKTIMKFIAAKCPKINVKQLQFADVMTIFIAIMEISKTGTQEMSFTCRNELPDKTICNNNIVQVINYSDAKVEGDVKNLEKIITVENNENISIKMYYPPYINLIDLYNLTDSNEYIIKTVCKCITEIYDNKEPIKNFNDNELYEWVKSLPQNTFKNMVDFVSTLPSVSISYKIVCPKCGNTFNYDINNLFDFL